MRSLKLLVTGESERKKKEDKEDLKCTISERLNIFIPIHWHTVLHFITPWLRN